jgi:hypothetical protein
MARRVLKAKPRPVRFVEIKSNWLAYSASGRIDAAFWTRVMAWLAERSLPPIDENVKRAIEEIEG